MMSDSLDNSKLQVAELRAELEARGLDTEGSQLVVERLREEALLQHAHDEVETEIKEELGNGYECSVKSEEIYIKEELIESEQEPSDTGDEVEDESEYDKSAVVVDWCIKREPGTDLQGPLPRAFSANEFAESKQEPFEERRGEKRQASNQQGPPDSKRCRPESADKHTDDAPYHDKEAVILDWHNRDLSLIIDKETFLSAKPMTSEDFAYAWHGVRARYGFLHGRLFYEVKVKDHLAVPHLEGEEHPHVVRCGWSINDAGMTLGEEPFSYGYDGRAKASTDMKIKDYGQPFGKGDVIGCFLDMDSEPITMSFSVNGKNFGKCYEVSRHSLRGKALFPHILTKNCIFKVNFGSEYPCFQPLARYRFVGQIPLVERVLGSQGPQTRQDSEVAGADETGNATPCTSQQVRRRRKTLSKSNRILDTVARRLEESVHKDDSGIDNFGSYIARTIHSMDPRTAIITRKLINDVLFEAEMGNLNSSSRVISTPQETVPLPIPSSTPVYSCSSNNSSNTND